MRKMLQAILVYGVSLLAMGYATLQLDLPILTQARADWPNGCCTTSMDCTTRGHLCWNIAETAACGTRHTTCPDGNACTETLWGYCNATRPDPNKGPGGFGE
jgi:hypothetical protein